MLKNKSFNFTNNMGRYTLIPRKPYRLQPEFAFAVWCFNMNVRRFSTFIRIKMKPVTPDFQNRWHGALSILRSTGNSAIALKNSTDITKVIMCSDTTNTFPLLLKIITAKREVATEISACEI
jgi:hypothetical protein